MYATWILDLYILFTDKESPCLDKKAWGWFTFRHWLTVNAWGTLGAVIVMIVSNLTVGGGDYKKSVEEGLQRTFG